MVIDIPHSGWNEQTIKPDYDIVWNTPEEIAASVAETFAQRVEISLEPILRDAEKEKERIIWNIQEAWKKVDETLSISRINTKVRELEEKLPRLSQQQIWTYFVIIADLLDKVGEIVPDKNIDTNKIFEIFIQVRNCPHWFIFTDGNADYVLIDSDLNVCRFPESERKRGL